MLRMVIVKGRCCTMYPWLSQVLLCYHQPRRGLVNVRLKWVKDRALDSTVVGQFEIKAVWFLISIISSSSPAQRSVHDLARRRGLLGLPFDLKLSTFIRRYPSVFTEFTARDSDGIRVPWFSLTPEAVNLHSEESSALGDYSGYLVDRLCKLLMLTREKTLPFQTISQLQWDLGLPYDYQDSILHNHPDLFSSVSLSDGRPGLRLLHWDDRLAVSELQKNAGSQQLGDAVNSGCLEFPVGFTRGYRLRRKFLEWLREWQNLPYTSPYRDPSFLDPRTDLSEKRIVGTFHELLHLTLQKRTERKNVSNLRKPLCLPQKFTKVFGRHPGIFYISKKGGTQTVVLREGYDGRKLLIDHPIVEFRKRLTFLMRSPDNGGSQSE